MAAPTRDEAMARLDEGQRTLETLFAKLSDEQMTRPATVGGEWSAKDLMGHIAFWEELAGEAVADWRAGRRPSVEEVFESGAEGIDAANARNQAGTTQQSLAEVRARAAAAHATVLGAIRSMSEEEWRTKASYPAARRRTLAELLGSILGAPRDPFRHAFAHVPDLKAYVESLERT